MRPFVRPDGSKLVEGYIAKEGVLDYETPGGELWREYVPAETLQASAQQLVGLPVTMEHPPEDVTPDNYQEYAVGSVISADWDAEANAVRCVLSIMRRDILEAVDSGKVELSPGYMADVDETPGNGPHGAYDAVQTGRGYNHVAFVDEARGGPAIRARVDSARHVITTQEPDPMNPNLIALCAVLGLGDFGTDDEALRAVRRHCDSMSEKLKRQDAEIEELKSDEGEEEKIDVAEYSRMKDENGKLKSMLDAMMSKMETAAMKPMADEYGVEVKQEDRADAIYKRIATKITGKPISDKMSMERIRGLVDGHYTANRGKLPRHDGVEAGRAAWTQPQTQPTTPPQPNQQVPDLFRPGPSAISERRADSAREAAKG